MLAAIQGPNKKAKLSRMLDGVPSLKGAITFLKDLKIFRRYSDREWIVIILLSWCLIVAFSLL